MNQTDDASQHRQEDGTTLTASQQPLSMMTISANPNRKEDLLIIRILEASERKIQLIKRLLTPDEFNSIHFDKYPVGFKRPTFVGNKEQAAYNSVPTDSAPRANLSDDLKRTKSWNGSETRVPQASNDLHSNLAKKREALEFFFQEQTSFPIKQDNLAIELRSGHYLGSTHEVEASKLIQNQPFSLTDRLAGLMGCLGISCPLEDATTMATDQLVNLNFIKYDIGRPYTRKRNIVAMRRRLQAVDDELNKIMRQCDSQWSTQGSNLPNLVDLAKMHKNHVVSSKLSLVEHNNQVKVVEPVGHFNTIHLCGPKKYVPNSQMDLILYEPVPSFLRYFSFNRRQDLSRSVANSTTHESFLQLKLFTLVITDHKLMLAEERAAMRLVELASKDKSLAFQKEQLLNELERDIDLLESRHSSDIMERLREICNNLVEITRVIVLNQQEILGVFSEIESLRLEQKFNSTSITVETVQASSLGSVRSLITKLVDLNRIKCKEDELNEIIKVYEPFLEQYTDYGCKEQNISTNFQGIQLTPTKECPVNEAERRKQLQHWLSSIRLKFLIGDKYFYDYHLSNKINEYSSLIYQIDLEQNQIIVPTPDENRSFELKVELSTLKHRLVPFLKQTAADATMQLPVDKNHTHSMSLQFRDKTSLARLNFESSPKFDNNNYPDTLPRESRCKSKLLIDLLHKKIFNLTFENRLDNQETKFARLINKCDTSVLVELLGYRVNHRPRFEMDPFIDHLEDRAHLDNTSQRPRWTKSTRQALIVWRWMNNLQQLVYLSERENAKNYSLQPEEFRSKLESIVVKKQESGYRYIEQMRALAVDYIKEYEVQLKEMLKYRAEEQTSRQAATKMKDFLREPELNMVDLSGVIRIARSLVPRRTANRPLLPRRRAAGNNRLLKAVASRSMGQLGDLAGTSADTEAQELGVHWQRLLGSHGASQLQLVVTIQQATNVPVRVVQTRPINQSTRPNSPFVQVGSPTNNFMTQLMPPVATTPIQYLVPPTTYVEIVFQRRQQASSLAQGKNPAWNETLFFPVDVATSNAGLLSQRDADRTDQLADEFLQLNLYDYHCYLQDGLETGFRSDERDASTIPVVSNNRTSSELGSSTGLVNHPSILGAQRIQATRQRIERHLLGSMRVPLITLMSSGRIEGSFALKQPLLLENYQFEPEMSLSHNFGPTMRANSPMAQDNWPNLSAETHISLFITLDPPISMPIHLLHLPTGSHESERVLELARLWEIVAVHHRHHANFGQQIGASRPSAKSRQSHRQRQNRHIRALVLQRDAKYCLISRLLVALEPPSELLEPPKPDKREAMHSLARFVSLMSPLKYGLFGMRLLASSLWFDSSQLIDKSLGGPEEKAVLLCNYFLYLGISAALLLGDAVPEGRCVYVIVWQEQSRFIESQLQLQAATLLESISSLAGAPNPDRVSELHNQRPIERSDFISRLPILMKANSILLFDPITGKSYSLSSRHPLISVGSIVTMENVYANIQSAENLPETNYDIRLKHFWFPLFDSSSSNNSLAGSGVNLTSALAKSLGAKQNSPQMNWRRQLLHLETMRKSVGHPNIGPILSPDAKLNYDKFSREDCNELKEAIEKVVKSHLLRWRPDRPTYFNRTLSRSLADKLALSEGYLNSATRTGDQDWRNELANLIKNEITMVHLSSSGLNTSQVISCPINLPYTSMKTLVDSIFASGVHNADLMLESSQLQPTSSSQFIVACHVHAYPARVMSVWLYVAAIIPNTK